MGPMAPGNQPPIPYTPKNGHLLLKTLHFRQHYATRPRMSFSSLAPETFETRKIACFVTDQSQLFWTD